MLDIFRNDAFATVSLTKAINKAPYKPSRIGAMGLFRERGMTTTTAVIEMINGRLSLIADTPRGAPASQLSQERRTARAFLARHLVRESTLQADQVQNVRAFGSEDATQGIQVLIDQELATLRAMHEVTLEYHRVGAIKGQILDADGTTVLTNLFTEFGVSQQTYTLDLGTGSFVRQQATEIQRLIEDELGAEPVSGYRAFCGDHFFDELIEHESVRNSLNFQESSTLRTDLRKGFEYGGITWENYRGRVGSIDFFDTDEAFVIPEGTSIFETYFAPADFLETVNTVGLPMYAKLAFDAEFNRWVKVHSQSNPLALCVRPRAVVKLSFTS